MRRLCFLSLLLSCIALSASSEEDFPGYRATYLDQMLYVDYLSTGTQKSDSRNFAYSDKNIYLNKIILQKDSGSISFTGGVRQVKMQLGTHFSPRHITYALLGSSFEYTGVDLWKWSANLSVQPDVHRFHVLRTTRYIGTLSGRYQHTKTMGLHFGAYVETGMRTVLVQPIIGADYTKGSWLFQAIFPIKAGVSYLGIPHHVFSLMGRSLYTAVSLEKGLFSHSSVAKYKGTGVELRWDLSPNPMWNFWASYGYTVTGFLHVGDRNFRHRKCMAFRPTSYGQVGLTLAL